MDKWISLNVWNEELLLLPTIWLWVQSLRQVVEKVMYSGSTKETDKQNDKDKWVNAKCFLKQTIYQHELNKVFGSKFPESYQLSRLLKKAEEYNKQNILTIITKQEHYSINR